MRFEVSLSEKEDHILLTAKGQVITLEDYRLLTQTYMEKLGDRQCTRILVDETAVEFSPSLLLQSDVVAHYDQDIGEEMKLVRVALVLSKESSASSQFWKNAAHGAGEPYEVFTSHGEAKQYLGVHH